MSIQFSNDLQLTNVAITKPIPKRPPPILIPLNNEIPIPRLIANRITDRPRGLPPEPVSNPTNQLNMLPSQPEANHIPTPPSPDETPSPVEIVLESIRATQPAGSYVPTPPSPHNVSTSTSSSVEAVFESTLPAQPTTSRIPTPPSPHNSSISASLPALQPDSHDPTTPSPHEASTLSSFEMPPAPILQAPPAASYAPFFQPFMIGVPGVYGPFDLPPHEASTLSYFEMSSAPILQAPPAASYAPFFQPFMIGVPRVYGPFDPPPEWPSAKPVIRPRNVQRPQFASTFRDHPYASHRPSGMSISSATHSNFKYLTSGYSKTKAKTKAICKLYLENR